LNYRIYVSNRTNSPRYCGHDHLPPANFDRFAHTF
jgi:hypothetical protein